MSDQAFSDLLQALGPESVTAGAATNGTFVAGEIFVGATSGCRSRPREDREGWTL